MLIGTGASTGRTPPCSGIFGQYGISTVEGAGLSAVPLYLSEVRAVVSGGMPRFQMWMRVFAEGLIPAHRWKFIPEISASELTSQPAALPIDRTLLEVLAAAKHLDQIQIVNGVVPGNVLRALRGEHVGTIIHNS